MVSGQDVYDDGVLRITRTGSPPVLTITGEIDESTYPGLVSTLESLVGRQREIHANLVGVTYCDLAGLRTIVGLAGANGEDHEHSGRRLVLHEVPQRLKTVLQIMGWDATPGLAIHEPGHCSHEPGHCSHEPGHCPPRARADQALPAAARRFPLLRDGGS
jgi:ABC-type transporter Mla MlaB component